MLGRNMIEGWVGNGHLGLLSGSDLDAMSWDTAVGLMGVSCVGKSGA
jgi:hypothetical protein